MMEEKKQDTLLEIKDLKVKFPVHKDWLPAVNGVNLEIYPGEIADCRRVRFRKECHVPVDSQASGSRYGSSI